MRVTMVIGNQDIYMICNILKILNIFIRTPHVVPFYYGENYSNYEGNESVAEGGKSQIMIHPLQYMLKYHNIITKI